jgi:hypothetical protein
MNRTTLATLLSGALVSCLVSCDEPQQVITPQLNLDRPVDIAFACYGQLRLPGGTIVSSAQPSVSCETRSGQYKTDLKAPPPGQEDLNLPDWFGFILQSAPGTVAIARWPSKVAFEFTGTEFEVIDADPLVPGKNAISIGEEPIAIATDKAGCFEVTANAGSCDLSTLEITTAVDDKEALTPIVVKRMQVKNASNVPIRARPAAMVAEPVISTVGNACPATATGLVYVAYPSCHLVAAVDVATEKIVAGIQFDMLGRPTITDGNVTCHDECPNDGGTLGGAPFMPLGGRPVTLDLKLDRPAPMTTTRRLVIGADNLASVTVVDLDASFLPVAGAPLQIPLEDGTGGKLGVMSVALSPRIAMGGDKGNNDNATDPPPAGFGQYVYAVATDDTVRVVDVLDVKKECDTQVDGRFVRGRPARLQQCIPVGDPLTPPRRVGARSPGVQLPGDAVPTSVAIMKGFDAVPTVEGSPDLGGPSILVGHFAIVTSSRGEAYVVNIDDDNGKDDFETEKPQETAPVLTMAHQLRDGLSLRGAAPVDTADALCTANNPAGGTLSGGPRGSVPVNNALGGVPNVISPVKALELPILRQHKCALMSTKDADIPVAEVQFTAPSSGSNNVRDQVFPDLGAVINEGWSFTWEGPLSTDRTSSVDGPQVRFGQMRVDDPARPGMHLLDQARPFCDMGVEPFDKVQLRGCNPAVGNADCPSGYDCFVHPQSQVAIGACILSTEAERLANACRDFLVSIRNYTVARADSGDLTLLPRKHFLRTSPIDGCTAANDDEQCKSLADYAARSTSSANPISDPTPPDPRRDTWRCLTDELSRPVNTDPARNKRCVQTCALHSRDTDGKDRDSDCDPNMICQGATATQRGFCMEGIVPPQACINGPQRFEVHAGEAFTVLGSTSGFVHPLIANPAQNGRCERAANASPLQIGRLPLTAPPCDPTADPITGRLPSGQFEPNPCSLTTNHYENRANYVDSTRCILGETQVLPRTRVAPAIKFRNRTMTLTLVDPFYPGDKNCILDRDGSLVGVPLVFPGYQLSFNTFGGYSPQTLNGITPTYPLKAVAGPSGSIWVIDDGDFLSNTPGRPSTRGSVFRVDPVALGLYILLQ